MVNVAPSPASQKFIHENTRGSRQPVSPSNCGYGHVACRLIQLGQEQMEGSRQRSTASSRALQNVPLRSIRGACCGVHGGHGQARQWSSANHCRRVLLDGKGRVVLFELGVDGLGRVWVLRDAFSRPGWNGTPSTLLPHVVARSVAEGLRG